MKLSSQTLFLALIFAGGIALAEGASDPDVKARQELMASNGAALRTLGGMASAKIAFDAAAAEAAKQVLVANAAGTLVVFKNQANDPASHASNSIWTAWDDFSAKASDLGKAAEALDTASADSIAAGLGAIGGTCKACHTAYKAS
ncbi:MAG: cytochrome c [Pseudomonadota bacterium]